MMTRRDSLRALGAFALMAAGIGAADEADAAQKKRKGVTKKATPKKAPPKRAAAPAYLPEVSSIVVLVQAEGFKILSADEPHARRTPASVTKLMTLCLMFEALDNGTLKLEDKITMSHGRPGGGILGLAPGRKISVADAILAIAVKSANDVALSVAEHMAGSESAFAGRMNAKAAAIGMRNSHFVNAHGMRDPDQYSTAYDLALLSYHLLTVHAQHYHYFSTGSFIFNGVTHRNHNGLMREYESMDGLKTGMTNHGWQLAASVERVRPADPENNRPATVQRLIGVFLGGQNKEQRNHCLGYLLDQGFITEGHKLGTSRFRYSPMACTSLRNKPGPM